MLFPLIENYSKKSMQDVASVLNSVMLPLKLKKKKKKKKKKTILRKNKVARFHLKHWLLKEIDSCLNNGLFFKQ